MCGRFVSTTPASDLVNLFGVDEVRGDLPARWNVSPSSEVWVVHDATPAEPPPERGVARVLEPMRWGLVPSWAKDRAIGNRMINARVETARTKPSFRSAFRRRRCILPVDGFYEWAAVPGQRARQPWYLAAGEGSVLALAGLWETHGGSRGSGGGGSGGDEDLLQTCTILTTAADAVVAPIHDRMPVALPADVWDTWLDPAIDEGDAVDALLGGIVPPTLAARRVGRDVGNPRNEGPALIDPID